MKLHQLLCLVLTIIATFALAWEKEDHEIFDLVSALEAAEGKGTTFYSWLGVSPTATTGEIAKAYRKKSMQLHPDKNLGVKGVHERFARLGVISTILRNQESRTRYDFFYKNGVPAWRGTGYYYSRFRPGLGSVLVFLVILTSLLQYLVQRINYTKDLERIERFQRDARLAAWGPRLVQVEGKRKVKVPLSTPRLDEEGNVVPGKMLEMVVEGTDVYILDPSGGMEILDSSAASRPGIRKTWFVSLVQSVIQRIRQTKAEEDLSLPDDDGDDPLPDLEPADGSSTTASEPQTRDGTATPPTAEATVSGRTAATKAGGRRRKATRKR